MKKIFLAVIALALGTVACSTSDFLPNASPTPVLDVQQPGEAPTEPQTARPTPTVVPVTDTPAATLVSSDATATATGTETSTPEPNLTTTPVTATSGPVDLSSPTITPVTPQTGGPTLTPTLGILTYGTLPPAVPFSKVTLINKSKAQAYISLQNHPADREVAILEYPVKGRVEVNAPLGYYVYVVWVGGKKITGDFTLHNGNDITITIYKDKVVVQQ